MTNSTHVQASDYSLPVTSELQLSVYEYKNHKLYASIENMFLITQLEHRWFCQMFLHLAETRPHPTDYFQGYLNPRPLTLNHPTDSRAMPYRAELTFKPETPNTLVSPLTQTQSYAL